MPQYLSPGVYVEEVPSSIKAITGVSSSTAAFIGVVPDKINLLAKGDPDANGQPTTKFVEFTLPAPDKEPRLITNWTQFTTQFGDLVGDPAAPTASGQNLAINEGHRELAHAVYGFFNNGGSRCFVVRVKAEADLDAALNALAAIDEIALVAAPGIKSDATREKLVTHCSTTGDRFAILDGPETEADLTALTRMPADDPPGVAPKRTDLAAWYFPWIKVFDPATKLKTPQSDGQINVPPSGHVAGVYARVDTQRGVFKAPANEPILGALNVTQQISKADQDGLNPKGVNCIRSLNDNILVWGARTVGGDANADLKYINVRRTLLFLRKSIDEGTQWAVFEPNTPALWQKITRNVSAFLTNVWRAGGLFGSTPQEAFFVKCDAETNPPELRELGQVVTEVGVAIVRPAEFVIFRISQLSSQGN
ncbi:MAG TPA: phage tail sheath subtilisin-like domain-containing protein [Blastocatellia bacterium]|nr:phage tail sheath subtilisin-like domain-containing protein [Blastocatellia bacterium]